MYESQSVENARGKTHLDSANVPRSERSKIVPFVGSSGVVDADLYQKVLEHAREELEVAEDDRVDPDLVAQLELDELGVRGARREHIAILLLN